MAELSKPGMGNRATRSCTLKLSSAPESDTVRSGSGWIVSRIFPRASSSLITPPFSIHNRRLATPDNHDKPCSHVPGGRAHGAQRRGYISSGAHGRRWMLATGNSSRYSRSRFLVRWLSGRKQRFAKAPYPKRVPRVRIPPSPPCPPASESLTPATTNALTYRR
jgi:hypothetical protein